MKRKSVDILINRKEIEEGTFPWLIISTSELATQDVGKRQRYAISSKGGILRSMESRMEVSFIGLEPKPLPVQT